MIKQTVHRIVQVWLSCTMYTRKSCALYKSKYPVKCTGTNILWTTQVIIYSTVYINKHTVQCTCLSIVYSVHEKKHTVHCTSLSILYSVHEKTNCTIHSTEVQTYQRVHMKKQTVHCTLTNKLYIVHEKNIRYNVQVKHTVQCTWKKLTMYMR